MVEGDGARVEQAVDALDAEEEEKEGELVKDEVHAHAEEGVGDGDGDDDGEEDGEHPAEPHHEARGEGRAGLRAPAGVGGSVAAPRR